MSTLTKALSALSGNKRSKMGKRSRLRPLILLAIVTLIVAQIVLLSPAVLENPPTRNGVPILMPEEVLETLKTDAQTLAPGIPDAQIPQYTINGFSYISTRGGMKQWRLLAERAFLYNGANIVHGRQVKAWLYDSNGGVTLVTGREAKYFMDGKDLEIFGNVRTRFSDGFVMLSEYIRYLPAEDRIEAPTRHQVRGLGKSEPETTREKLFQFQSQGIQVNLDKNEVWLPKAVRLEVEKKASPQNKSQKEEKTVVLADRCRIDREKNMAFFSMYPERPPEKSHVTVTQKGFFLRSRLLDLDYGDYETKNLKAMVAREDVYFKETEEEEVKRYGTCGVANYDLENNTIVLTEFPQVYQGTDTVTGEKIIVYRDKDLVEVEQSNAFTETQDESKKKKAKTKSGKKK